MTNPLVGHVLGSHGHVLLGHMLGHVLGQGLVGHVMGISQDHMVEDSRWLLVIDQTLSRARGGIG